MPDQIEILPTGPVTGTIRPPGSKSITNRALVCAALARGDSLLRGALVSEDTHVMIDSLRKLGVPVEESDGGTTLHVAGCDGRIPSAGAELFIANSGTSIRFLTALAALGNGRFRLDGIERMRQRPIEDLLAALRTLGADVHSEATNGCPPVTINASGLTGGEVSVRGDISSQYLSGLLMAAPYAKGNVQISVVGPLVSRPYISITLAVMNSFGVDVQQERLERFEVQAPQCYVGHEYEIEPDASAASYFWAAAAITRGQVRVEGLSCEALQGDVAFVDCLAKMGCQVSRDENAITVQGSKLRGIDINMNAISDTVQTLTAAELFAEGSTTITGVAHNRHKETDRIGDLATELRKFGATVEELEDGLRISPPKAVQGAVVDTYDDHRMAMSLALVGLRAEGVAINNPGCTQKTYPRFFDDLAELAGS